MDFDLNQIAVPFRMQPGLRRLAPGGVQLTPLLPGSRLYAEKKAVVDAGAARHQVSGFDPAPALETIDALGRQVGVRSATPSVPELAFEEDFAILDGATGTVPWLCVCVPSHWAPEDKLGLDFAALHQPVADNAALLSAASQLVSLVTGGQAWERFVWTLAPSPRYDQHPRRHPRAQWPVAANDDLLAGECCLRVERQCFTPVERGTAQALFSIRVMVEPLTQAVSLPEIARRLRDSLATMSPAVLDYKNLTPVREPLLRWLSARS
jgi:hypothetical protein